MKKVELLAPAGNFEGLTGAVTAGADAVYLGGERFGARAYADNFTQEELLRGLHYAHLHERKVYLTVNTLIKEKEFGDLYPYVAPLYEAGLDGVIVQDMGALRWLREQFPLLSLHASTQMNVTHALGVALLKKLGVDRVVPARELTLEELREIRKRVDMELETFIHGAMCYSYSGQCLFSSLLGGRSGNRGRCAQPCRLPYTCEGRTEAQYLLSMKDMCTVEMLPELIEAGISSFKIEGRMKKPEYAAGVTSIYRKYIDLYYKMGKDHYRVSDEDRQYLTSLYIRSETGEGYYRKLIDNHNDRHMITLKKPGYGGSEESLMKEIRARFLVPSGIAVSGKGSFTAGRMAVLTLTCRGVTVSVEGNRIETAQNAPLTEESVKRHLNKMGNTSFYFEELQVSVTGNGFMPVKAINELRRTAMERLEQALLAPHRRTLLSKIPPAAFSSVEKDTGTDLKEMLAPTRPPFHIYIVSLEQWRIAIGYPAVRIYAAIDLWEARKTLPVKAVDQEWFAVLPRIFRLRDEAFLDRYRQILLEEDCKGVLVQNLESCEWLYEWGYPGTIVADSCLYSWNMQAMRFWQDQAAECYLPLELRGAELEDIVHRWSKEGEKRPAFSLQVYGRVPMMVSANCVRRTMERCDRESDVCYIRDRYGKSFPVRTDCRHCYNIIYNAVPLSLHDPLAQGKLLAYRSLRLDFTTESGQETDRILFYWYQVFTQGKSLRPPYQEYTTGHYKRGAE